MLHMNIKWGMAGKWIRVSGKQLIQLNKCLFVLFYLLTFISAHLSAPHSFYVVFIHWTGLTCFSLGLASFSKNFSKRLQLKKKYMYIYPFDIPAMKKEKRRSEKLIMQWKYEALYPLLPQEVSWAFHYGVSNVGTNPLTPLRRAAACSGLRWFGPRIWRFTEADKPLALFDVSLSVQKHPSLRGVISSETVSKETFFVRYVHFSFG